AALIGYLVAVFPDYTRILFLLAIDCYWKLLSLVLSACIDRIECKRRLRDLLLLKDNRFCADCRASDPKWASANIGVFICLKCCGVHRSLGAHISKVLSVTLDEWNDDEIDAMIEIGGNSSANAIYEAFIPDGFSKPGPDASHEQRSRFIRLEIIK
ncbi:ADP-ribosylation factor GTPase-activating protein AGD12, partial [Cucurbita argyrosperma subsp. argyrosperma]